MPPQGKAFKQYLEQKDFRYTYWTTDSVVNLKGDQKYTLIIGILLLTENMFYHMLTTRFLSLF